MDTELVKIIGKTVERVYEGDMTVTIWFTDGTYIEIEAHTTEEGYIRSEFYQG